MSRGKKVYTFEFREGMKNTIIGIILAGVLNYVAFYFAKELVTDEGVVLLIQGDLASIANGMGFVGFIIMFVLYSRPTVQEIFLDGKEIILYKHKAFLNNERVIPKSEVEYIAITKRMGVSTSQSTSTTGNVRTTTTTSTPYFYYTVDLFVQGSSTKNKFRGFNLSKSLEVNSQLNNVEKLSEALGVELRKNL